MPAKKLRISLALSTAALAAGFACPQAWAEEQAVTRATEIITGVSTTSNTDSFKSASAGQDLKFDSKISLPTQLSDYPVDPSLGKTEFEKNNQKWLDSFGDSATANQKLLDAKLNDIKNPSAQSAATLARATSDAQRAADILAKNTCEANKTTCVKVTEAIPGVSCVKADVDPKTPVYFCPVGKNFSGFFDVLKGLLKYAVVIGVMVGVLMIVVSGIRLSLGSAFGDDGKAAAKEALMKAVGGVASIILLGAILNTVAPWVFK